MSLEIVAPLHICIVFPACGAIVKFVKDSTIVKLALEMSKKMWLCPFTMIRLVVPVLLGTVIVSDPSLVTLVAKVIDT